MTDYRLAKERQRFECLILTTGSASTRHGFVRLYDFFGGRERGGGTRPPLLGALLPLLYDLFRK